MAAWVLGALDPATAEEVERHVADCAECAATVRRLNRAASLLPLAAGAERPPEGLRARILAAATEAPRVVEPATVIPLRRRRRLPRLRVGWPAAAVAALAVAVLGLAAWNYSLSQQLAQPARQTYSLQGTGPMAGVEGEVVHYPRDGITLVDLRNLPPPVASRVYEAWLISADGRPLPAGVFRPDAGGSYTLVVGRPISGVKVVAVTSEPAPDGSAQPTEEPQLSARIA